jgi:hypothetical protein
LHSLGTATGLYIVASAAIVAWEAFFASQIGATAASASTPTPRHKCKTRPLGGASLLSDELGRGRLVRINIVTKISPTLLT